MLIFPGGNRHHRLALGIGKDGDAGGDPTGLAGRAGDLFLADIGNGKAAIGNDLEAIANGDQRAGQAHLKTAAGADGGQVDLAGAKTHATAVDQRRHGQPC